MKRITTLAFALLATSCASAVAPRPPPPLPVEPPPVVIVAPPTDTPTHGGESGWLNVDGYRFAAEGQPWVYRGFTDFQLLAKYCATLNGDPQIDLDAHLTERIGHGAKVLRVLGMAHYLFRFNPATTPDYWPCVEAFAEHLGRRGVRLEFVVFADADEVMPGLARQLAHFDQAVVALARHWNALGELANEAEKNLKEWRAFPRPRGVGTLWSHGSGLSDALPPTPFWDWTGWHGRRDFKVYLSHEDMWFVQRGLTGDGRPSAHGPTRVVANEPMGFGEVEQRDRRSTDCALARVLALTSDAFGSGGAYHSEDGLYSRPLGPRQTLCAAAFFAAFN
jgi:hypothetical protein